MVASLQERHADPNNMVVIPLAQRVTSRHMKSDPSGVVAANVRAEIARRRIRQVDVAASLGMSQQALSRRLTGEVAFDVGELHEVAALLETTAAALLAPEPTAAVGT